MSDFFSQKFSSYKDFEKNFKKFQNDTFQVFVVRSSRKIDKFKPDSEIFMNQYIFYVSMESKKILNQSIIQDLTSNPTSLDANIKS